MKDLTTTSKKSFQKKGKDKYFGYVSEAVVNNEIKHEE
jgi:hypothetical protein